MAEALRARLVSEMTAGAAVSELSRREGICVSVLHRCLRRARKDADLPGAGGGAAPAAGAGGGASASRAARPEAALEG